MRKIENYDGCDYIYWTNKQYIKRSRTASAKQSYYAVERCAKHTQLSPNSPSNLWALLFATRQFNKNGEKAEPKNHFSWRNVQISL